MMPRPETQRVTLPPFQLRHVGERELNEQTGQSKEPTLFDKFVDELQQKLNKL